MSTYRICTSSQEVAKLNHGQEELNIESLGLYLAPGNNVEGIDTCPAKSPICEQICLWTSGFAGIYPSVNEARKKRTEFFRDDRDGFMQTLMLDLLRLTRRAAKYGRQAVARLNCTSDIMFEHIPVVWRDIPYRSVMEAFPDVEFYDYTKLPSRIAAFKAGRLPSNYHVTFSLSENNDRLALRALECGLNVAVPMHIKKHEPPTLFSGYPTVDGDLHDYRCFDPKGGHIVCLSPKGRAAKKDHEFVKDIDYTLDATKRVVFA